MSRSHISFLTCCTPENSCSSIVRCGSAQESWTNCSQPAENLFTKETRSYGVGLKHRRNWLSKRNESPRKRPKTDDQRPVSSAHPFSKHLRPTNSTAFSTLPRPA